MSQLGRPFGLSFGEKEKPEDVSPVPPQMGAGIGQAFGLTFGSAMQNGEAVDPASGAPAPVMSSPARPASAETVQFAGGIANQPPTTQGAPGSNGAAAPADAAERDRRQVRADADYQRKLHQAMFAAGALASDDGRAGLIEEIARYRGWTREEAVERVNRDYVREERDYRISQPYDGNQRQRYMIQGDRGTAWQVHGDEAAMNDADAKLKKAGLLLERDPFGEPVKSAINRLRGSWGGVGEAPAGGIKFHAGAEVAQERRVLDDMQAVIEGTTRPDPNAALNVRQSKEAAPQRQKVPFRLDAHTHFKVREFMQATPQRQAEMYEEQRLLVERPIAENSSYRSAKEVEAWFYEPADPGFEQEHRKGRELGRGLVQAAAGLSILGIPFVVASESGHRMGEAVELGANQDQYLEVRDRAAMLGMFMSLPFGKAIGKIPGVKRFGDRVETGVGSGGKILLKIGEKGSEGVISGILEGHLQDQIIKDVFDPERETSDGALQAAIRSFANEPALRSPQTQILTATEVSTAHARAANALVSDFADSMRAVQYGMRISANGDALSQYVDISVPNRAVAMPIAEVTRLLESGKITPEIVKQWGVEGQVANGGTAGDVVIPLRRLMKARLAPEHIDDIARSVRFGEKTLTGHEAADFLKQRDVTLAELATRMKVAKPVPDEGAFIFADASDRLRKAGWSNEEAERGAARIVEAFIDKAREDENKAAKRGADYLYFREVSRSEGAPGRTRIDNRLKQEFETFSEARANKSVGSRYDSTAHSKGHLQP